MAKAIRICCSIQLSGHFRAQVRISLSTVNTTNVLVGRKSGLQLLTDHERIVVVIIIIISSTVSG